MENLRDMLPDLESGIAAQDGGLSGLIDGSVLVYIIDGRKAAIRF